MNNDANEFPYRIALDETDPLYVQKTELLGASLTKRTYRVMASLGEEATYKFFSYLRLIEHEGDMMLLVASKMKD